MSRGLLSSSICDLFNEEKFKYSAHVLGDCAIAKELSLMLEYLLQITPLTQIFWNGFSPMPLAKRLVFLISFSGATTSYLEFGAFGFNKRNLLSTIQPSILPYMLKLISICWNLLSAFKILVLLEKETPS